MHFSTRLFVNTGSTLTQAANDEERVVGSAYPGVERRRARALIKHPLYMYIFGSISRLASCQ